MLPVATYKSLYEEYFATPQNINFANLSQTYELNYKAIEDWQKFKELLENLPNQDIHLWEIKTNRQTDSIWLKETLNKLCHNNHIG